ncbi:RNA polymerase sigma-70 factor [Aureibacter tunicatorum]|uniref:RNA polymerase sigma-70 factor (ECF subfamily) n=1 Tax=Aureibacter tunicatorum TaxID=866807 RepID=A0AAE3XQJ5_9BACT|nr:RNA polymerase sigma-70 factor [Aureibacter tunicatorum]MDR6241292.1 RNA polymerase sigma-70 factor (ECF subfamily) [Aureibacter tunicatorum]BDD03552.1 DNA-directed RNA polymerase sigma-70 factor [Aureibacter tunicatorum]
MKNLEDDILLEKFKSGDVNAYEVLFKRHYKNLCLFSAKHLQSYDLAEEVVQELFCKLWEKRSNLNIHSSFKSYLYTATRLNSLKEIQTRQLHSEHHKVIKTNSSDSVEDQTIEKNELQAKIHETISSLPEQRRKVFEMSRNEGLKYKEIADKLNISPKTVENQMGKALRHMREALKEYLPAILVFFSIFFKK